MLTSSPEVRKLVQADSRMEVLAKVWPAGAGQLVREMLEVCVYSTGICLSAHSLDLRLPSPDYHTEADWQHAGYSGGLQIADTTLHGEVCICPASVGLPSIPPSAYKH